MSRQLKFLLLLSLSLNLCASAAFAESTLKHDKAAHAAAKAAAMKYLSKRKPAQEGQMASVEEMRSAMAELLSFLDSDETNRDKFQAIQTTRYRVGVGLKNLLKKPSTPQEQLNEAYRYDNTLIYLTQLALDTQGHWTKVGCNHAITMIDLHGYDPGHDTTNPESNDQSTLAVIKHLCNQ